jgi:hypothetical protein
MVVLRSPAANAALASFSKELYRSTQDPAPAGSATGLEEARAGAVRGRAKANPASETNARTMRIDFMRPCRAIRMPLLEVKKLAILSAGFSRDAQAASRCTRGEQHSPWLAPSARTASPGARSRRTARAPGAIRRRAETVLLTRTVAGSSPKG